MNGETSTKKKLNSVSLTVIFFTLVFTCLCLLIPVWQCSENNRMRSRLNAYQSELNEREEIKMVLESEVAVKSSPEFLMGYAKDIDIDLMPISGAKTIRVACNW